MVLEYLPGGTLEDRLRDREPLPDDEAYEIAAGIAAGLAHAHARGVVHRDLKPANVLFDEEGRPKIADFGIARMAAGEGTLTEAGTLLGTAAYISPEQASGEPATAASDVYSFGVILYRHARRAAPVRVERPDGARADAPRRAAAADRASSAPTRPRGSSRRRRPRSRRIPPTGRPTAPRCSPSSACPQAEASTHRRPRSRRRTRRGCCPLGPAAAVEPSRAAAAATARAARRRGRCSCSRSRAARSRTR